MKQLILIEVESAAGLEPENNFWVKDTVTGKIYAGNGTAIPDEVLTTNTPVIYSRIYLYE